MAVNDTTLQNSVTSILGYKSTATTDTANATAATTEATGYGAEGTAYQTAEDIAKQNAVIAQQAGNVKELQEARSLRQTVGQQRSAQAANGFKEAGSSLDILRDSLQQGYLTQQLTATQTALTAGGYLEEAAASAAELEATKVTSGSAVSNAAAYTSAATSATTAAANETASLSSYTSGANLTSDEQLILAPLSGSTTSSGGTSSLSSTVVNGGSSSEALSGGTKTLSGGSETLSGGSETPTKKSTTAWA